MTLLLKVTPLILLSVMMLSIGCDTHTPPDRTLPWEEYHGQFNTLDLARAQEEIPFPIVLPSYIPDKRQNPPPPNIRGPLGEFQYNDKVQIEVYYSVDFGGETYVTILIEESNYPVLPPDPKLNPGFEVMEIRGKEIITKEGNFSPGPGVVFFFSQDQIYFVVHIYNLPTEEATKVVDSMLE